MPRVRGDNKECRKCKTIKASEDFHKKKRKRKDGSIYFGLDYICKICKKEQDNKRCRQEDSCSWCGYEYKPTTGGQKNCSKCLDKARLLKQNLHALFSTYNRPYTPSWCNKEEMREIVKERVERYFGGRVLEFDHIVPLKSPFVCGLNVPDNIRLIPKKLNRVKNNYYWPDMPETSQIKYFLNHGFRGSNLGEWSCG